MVDHSLALPRMQVSENENGSVFCIRASYHTDAKDMHNNSNYTKFQAAFLRCTGHVFSNLDLESQDVIRRIHAILS